jgi:hypothetical protein
VPRSDDEDPDGWPLAHRANGAARASLERPDCEGAQKEDNGSISRTMRRDGVTPSSRCSRPQ